MTGTRTARHAGIAQAIHRGDRRAQSGAGSLRRFFKIEIVLSNTAVIISSSMRAFTSAATIAAFLIATLPSHAQTPDAGARDRLVVSATWLAQHVNDPGQV